MLLKGIKILDLTRLMPPDYGSMLLADMGAEVIKVEAPAIGDYMRWMPPVNKEENYVFLLGNRNKKSITLDLKKNEGKKVFFRLAEEADVIFESFRPGVVKRLGIDYEAIRAVRPDVIYCSCTGYGQTGPYSQRPSKEINYIATSGILGLTGRHTGKPVIPGVPIADMTVGVFSALSICAALIGRMNSGEGQYIDIASADCMVAYLTIIAAGLFGKSELPMPLSGGQVWYESFETRDGKFIAFSSHEEKFWFNFCDVIGREDLKEYTVKKRPMKEGIMEEVKEIIRTKTRKEWLDLMEGKDICYASVNELEEVFKDPQVEHRQMYFEIQHPVEGRIGQIALPIKFSGMPSTPRQPPPRLGEHTEEVLKKAGYSERKIKELRNVGVI